MAHTGHKRIYMCAIREELVRIEIGVVYSHGIIVADRLRDEWDAGRYAIWRDTHLDPGLLACLETVSNVCISSAEGEPLWACSGDVLSHHCSSSMQEVSTHTY